MLATPSSNAAAKQRIEMFFEFNFIFGIFLDDTDEAKIGAIFANDLGAQISAKSFREKSGVLQDQFEAIG